MAILVKSVATLLSVLVVDYIFVAYLGGRLQSNPSAADLGLVRVVLAAGAYCIAGFIGGLVPPRSKGWPVVAALLVYMALMTPGFVLSVTWWKLGLAFIYSGGAALGWLLAALVPARARSATG